MENKNIKEKTISGISWSFTGNIAEHGMTFLVGIVLARLLSPREFGLVGMIYIFIAVSQSLVDSGFSQALIRKKDCEQKDYNTVFFFNVFVGIVLYILLFVFSDYISKFYDEPQLTPLIRVLGLIIIIKSFGLIQRTILIKQVNFKIETKIVFFASLFSGLIAIYMAYTGWGVWALVWKTILLDIFIVLLFWIWNKWRPTVSFSISSFKEMFGFGSLLMVSGILNTIAENIYFLVIGKFFSATDLGYFTKAMQFKKLPSKNFSNIFARVSYPVFSSIQNDKQRLKNGYKKMIKISAFVTFVSMIGLASVAEPLIVSLIGIDWLPSVGYLQLLCFVGMLHPLHSLNLNILKVKGRSDLFLKLEIFKKILIVPAVFVGYYLGIHLMIVTMILNSIIALFINSFYSSKLIDYKVREQLLDVAPALIIALLMGGAVYFMGALVNVLPGILLCIQIVLGGIIIVVISEAIKLQSYKDIKSVFLQKVKKLRLINK